MAMNAATTRCMEALEVVDTHMRAVAGRDIAALERTLGTEVLLIAANGDVVLSRDEFLQRHREWFALDAWAVDASLEQIIELDGSAMCALHLTYVPEPGADSEHSTLTLGLLRVDREWKVIFDQNTPHR